MEQLYPSQFRRACPATIRVSSDQGRAKVHSHRKYVFTDQIDQLIREIYLNHRDAKTRPGIRLLAKKVGMPHWALKKRARELALSRTKELPWNEAELAILSRYAWMSDERIRLKLRLPGTPEPLPESTSSLSGCDSSMTGASTPPTVLRKRWGSTLTP